MSSIMDCSQLEGAQDFSLENLSQIKLTSLEKQSNGPALKGVVSQLITDRRVSTEDESLSANVGSPESPESDVTLPYSPRFVDRRASGDSFTPPLIEVIECEPEIRKESFAERIAAVDAAIEAQAQVTKQNKRNSRAQARHTEYNRPSVPSETVFRPHYVAPMRW